MPVCTPTCRRPTLRRTTGSCRQMPRCATWCWLCGKTKPATVTSTTLLPTNCAATRALALASSRLDDDHAGDCPRQFVARVGLAEQLPARRRIAVGLEQLRRETRHQQDRQLRQAVLSLRGQFGAAHAGAQRD